METPVYHLEQAVLAKESREDFDGPLDLILHLLSKNKMDISDIRISEILDQYLEWMERRKRLDLEVASEFVVMASQLVFIKTRMLLNAKDEEAVSELEQLKAELQRKRRQEDYLRLKTVTGELNLRYLQNRNYFSKPPEPIRGKGQYRYVHSPEDLVTGLQRAMSRDPGQEGAVYGSFSGIVGHEQYPVAGKAMELVRRLMHSGVTRFRSLFRGAKSRSEVVATFLAVLELAKNRRILLAGDERECTVTVTGDYDENDPLTTEEFL